MRKHLHLVLPALACCYLAVCGAVETIQEKDVVKGTLLVSWISVSVLYWVWKKRAIEAWGHIRVMMIEGGLFIQEGTKLKHYPWPTFSPPTPPDSEPLPDDVAEKGDGDNSGQMRNGR